MIKIILLKDAEANRGVVFAKACVESNGFMIELGVGYIKKTKETVLAKGSIAMELPDTYIDRVSIKPVSFEDTEGAVQTRDYISIN